MVKVARKISSVFNGETKWILTLIITVFVAVIAYGRQLQAIDFLILEVNKKADISVVEEKIKGVSKDVGDIKKDISIIQGDIKVLLQRSKE